MVHFVTDLTANAPQQLSWFLDDRAQLSNVPVAGAELPATCGPEIIWTTRLDTAGQMWTTNMSKIVGVSDGI